ncbi:glycosyltransferase [Bradyrhizobium sp. Gha]|uniref:glycosyltransferase family 2 protein n=1 Tax=Bradyrhizobium sp. Gha TaxID=1855318 RepID=UPI0015A67AC9|nr:glycosyltransferase [Bradyrhizobium sp. Gha]
MKDAFRLADRRCRTLPVAQARHYTLRAEIAYRLDFEAAALRDIIKALELAPDDLAANRRLLQWGTQEQRAGAARRLIRRDRDMNVLAEALTILKTAGETTLGALHQVGEVMTGWAVWRGRGKLILRIEDGADVFHHSVESDPQHLLAGRAEHAASFALEFPPSAVRRVARLMIGNHTITESTYPPPLGGRLRTKAPATSKLVRGPKKRAAAITIIVPVYDDFEATRRCLNSLKRALPADDTIDVILVDDATPDKRIASLLDTFVAPPGSQFRLLRNMHNLGFIGAVNRALEETPSGDVILLNSDTVVPKGFARRLSEAAWAAPDIGTVTPFSNNGEATSLPQPFTANPLPSIKEIEQLDAIAARVNAGRVVDMPDGIGFCLYITRACLDAVGGLSDHYHRGYLEDVDLCLRARQHGFRNVCATSVFVGHAGSASFKGEKRALVVLNLERLRLRFPNYRVESATFKAQDPLRPSRGAIERELISRRKGAEVILSSSGTTLEVARQFALGRDEPVLHATLDRSGTRLCLRDSEGSFPQSIEFSLSPSQRALEDTLAVVAPSRILLADPGGWLRNPAGAPMAMLRDLLDRPVVLDLLVADASFWCPRGSIDEKGDICRAILLSKDCACGGEIGNGLDLLSRDSLIFAPDTFAKAFVKRLLPPNRAKQIRLVHDARRPHSLASRGAALGLLPAGHGASEFAFMCETVRQLRRHRTDLEVVIFGETLDDLALMALGNVTVTGAISSDEVDDIATLHGIGGILAGRRTPLFGHPLMLSAYDLDLPLAFFDWSSGEVDAHRSDLALDPALSAAGLAEAVLKWSNDRW